MLRHDDLDHTGGASSLLQAMPVGWLSSPLLPDHALSQQANEARRCSDGQTWEWDGVKFEVLHPLGESSDSKPRDNDSSCVLRISTGNQHVLLAGDIEKDSEQRLLGLHPDKLHASLLVAPHHGSKSSSGYGFVAATLPDYAVFTVGYRNRFGHPRKEVLQRSPTAALNCCVRTRTERSWSRWIHGESRWNGTARITRDTGSTTPAKGT